MLLVIIVGLVVIERHVACIINVSSAGVVLPPVGSDVFARGIVPGVVGAFRSVERDEFDDGILAEIAALQKIGIEMCRSALDIAVAADVGQASAESPVTTQKPRAELQVLFVRAVGAGGKIGAKISVLSDVVRLHVDRCPESSAAVGGSAEASLNLDALKAGSDIGQIDPVYGIAFGIV